MRYIQTLIQEVNEDIENYLRKIEKIQNRVLCKQKEEIYKYIIPLKKKVEDKEWLIETKTIEQIIRYVSEHAFLPDSYAVMLEDIEEKLRDDNLQRFEKELLSKR